MFGSLYGNVIGSYYEVHCTKDYNFPFERNNYFTDDSVLIAAVCKKPRPYLDSTVKFTVKEFAEKFVDIK